MEQRTGVLAKYWDEQKLILQYKYFIFNGKKEGEYKEYYTNRYLFHIYNYKNNKREGEYKHYKRNNQLQTIYNYKNNNIHGECKEYHDNGQLMEICNYNNNYRMIEECILYDTSGKILRIDEYQLIIKME